MFDEAWNFYINHKSTRAAVEEFFDSISEGFKDLKKKDQKIVVDNIQHMFRKWYYSTIIEGTPITPANIINTLFEREYGSKAMVLPTIEPLYKGKKFEKFTNGIVVFTREDHPAVHDLTELLEAFMPDAGLDEDDMLLEEERARLKGNIFLNDKHYIDFLTHIAWEMELIVKMPSIGVKRGQTAALAKEFLKLDNSEKLDRMIKAAIKISSRELSQTFPVKWGPFSQKNIESLLKKPKEIDKIFIDAFKPLGVDINELTQKFDEGWEPSDDMEQMAVMSHYVMGILFDIWFLTPFGYYLQLIQPIYTYPYNVEFEITDILAAYKESADIEAVNFAPCTAYDLTPLGEQVLVKGKKPAKIQKLPDDFDDDMFYTAVTSSSMLDMMHDDDNEEDNPFKE